MMIELQIAAGLRALWEDNLLLDYSIHAENHEFSVKVHKVILASVSDYFRVMLTGGLLESQEDSVHLKGVSAVAVKELVKYIYTGKMVLSGEIIMDVLAGAVHLQIEAAIRECEKYMLENLDVDNCLDVLAVFKTYSLTEAAEGAKRFIQENAQKLTGEGKTDELSYDELHLIFDNWPRSELDLFLWVKQWVMVDYETRKIHLDELVGKHVRFSLIPSDGLEYIQSMEFYRNGEGAWKGIVDAAVQYHRTPIHHKVFNDSVDAHIRSEESLIAFSIDVDGQYTSSDFYALQNDWCWRKLPSMTHTSLQASVLVINNFLLVCGGCDASNLLHASNKCHIFDPRTFSWSQLASMSQARKNFPLVSSGRFHMYAIGGCPGYKSNNEAMVSRAIEAYDFRRNKWTKVADLPNAVRKHSACSYGNGIYVCGGIPEGETTNFGLSKNLDHLDLATMTWGRKAPMLSSRFDHLMCVISHLEEEVIFVIGLNLDLEYYSPSTDQWTKYLLFRHRDLPAYATMLASNNTIYFIAGRAIADSDSVSSDDGSNDSAQFVENICVKLSLTDSNGEAEIEHLPDFPVQDGIPLIAMLAISPDTMDESLMIKPKSRRGYIR